MSDMPNEVPVEPKKGRKPFLIAGGIGCLLMLLLLVGVIGAGAYFGQDLSQEIQGVESDLMTSSAVEEELGSPIVVKPNILPEVSELDGVKYATMTGIVSGPKGEGAYRAKFTTDGVEYDLQSLTVDVNGKQIDVSDEGELDLGIELGE